MGYTPKSNSSIVTGRNENLLDFWLDSCRSPEENIGFQYFFGNSEAEMEVINSLPSFNNPQDPLEALGSFQPILCSWAWCKSKEKPFLTQTALDYHIKTYHLHQCPRPFCTSNSFKRNSDLKRHIASVHSGNRQYSCDATGCKLKFARKVKLTAHKAKVHALSAATSMLDTPVSAKVNDAVNGSILLEYVCTKCQLNEQITPLHQSFDQNPPQHNQTLDAIDQHFPQWVLLRRNRITPACLCSQLFFGPEGSICWLTFDFFMTTQTTFFNNTTTTTVWAWWSTSAH
jgi:hypothetical protein